MATYVETFDAGTDGGTPNSGNTIFDTIVASGTGGTILFDNDHTHSGTLAALVDGVGTSGAVYFTKAVTGAKKFAASVYVWLSGTPDNGFALMGFYIGSTRVGTVQFNSSQKIRFTGAASTSDHVWTAVNNFPTGQWVRVDVYLEVGTTTANGSVRLAYYTESGGDSATAVEDSGLIATANLGTADLTGVRLGVASTGTEADPFWIDSFQLKTAADAVWPVGPYVPVIQLATPVVTKGATSNATTIGGSNGTQTVTWPAVSGAGSYDAMIATTATPSQGDFTLVEAGVTSPYVFDGLEAGTYAFGIIARP